jgi:hypothetical protein
MGCVEINMLPFSPPFLPLLLSGFILALPSLDLCLTGVFGLVVATSLCHFITATNQSAFFRRSRPFQTFFPFVCVLLRCIASAQYLLSFLELVSVLLSDVTKTQPILPKLNTTINHCSNYECCYACVSLTRIASNSISVLLCCC